ncbi:MAG TPA: EAL domain-containing protein [Gaiellales bacterium]|jgi:diguanylate cyclase (GGDEF)-like protein/PAS domain S-box-containing protein|nr:EAL domain-containing protein [Gaiellales bacterium]
MRHDTTGVEGERLQQARQRLHVHLEITRILGEAVSLADATPRVLEQICRGLGWDLAALWRVDRDAGVIRCVDLWHAPGTPLIGFSLATRHAAFQPGEGLPGVVWKEGAARWVPDIGGPQQSVRSAPAAREGVRAALGLPLLARGEAIGVLELFSSRAARPDEDAMQLLAAIASLIAQFIRRRDAERHLRDTEARTSAIVNAALDSIIGIDGSGHITEFNPAAEATFGRRREEVLGMELRELLVPDDAGEPGSNVIDRMLSGAEPEPLGRVVEAVGLDASGREFPVELAVAQVDVPGAPAFSVFLRDVTESRRAQDAARQLAAIVETTGDAILSKSLDGTILTWNRGAELLYGYTAEEAIGSPITMLAPPDRVDEADEILRRVGAGERIDGLETVRRRKDGSLVDVSLTVSPLERHDGTVGGASVIARDITERRRTAEQIAHLAYHDQLTGLPNRTMFHEHLETALARADRHGLAVAVLFIDLDNFKLVNDSFGHEAGDDLLRDFGERLTSVTRATDIVARQGGDEFLVLVPDLEIDGGGMEPRALEVVASIEQKVRSVLETPFRVAGTEVHVGLSIGVSIYPIDATDREQLLRNADTAMYIGKGRLERDVSAEPEHARGRLEMLREMRRAVEQHEFELYFQPIVELDTRRLVGVETLVRWRDPRGELVLPEAFIPLAERSGLIEPITREVIDGACLQARRWADRGADMIVTFNLPPGLWSPGMVETLLESARRAGIEPDRMMIEVTESTAMVQPARAASTVRLLRKHGIRLAIDDFGTGHSSLGRLRDLPVSTLKIDRSFVADLPRDRGSAAIVTAIIQLAHSLGVQPLAEGIETQEQLDFLIAQGCRLGQGYLLGRPAPADDIDLEPALT